MELFSFLIGIIAALTFCQAIDFYYKMQGKNQFETQLKTVIRKSLLLKKQPQWICLPDIPLPHCHDKEERCIPFIEDCEEHYRNCSDGCHEECACQDREY